MFNNTNTKTAFRAKNTSRKQTQQNQKSNEYNPVLYEIASTDRKKKVDTIQSGTNSRITYKKHKTKYSKSQRRFSMHSIY